jgi:hypothetical protein
MLRDVGVETAGWTRGRVVEGDARSGVGDLPCKYGLGDVAALILVDVAGLSYFDAGVSVTPSGRMRELRDAAMSRPFGWYPSG